LSARALEPGGYYASANPYVFGYGDTQNLFAPHRGVVLLPAVTARDEYIPPRIGNYQAVQAEAMIGLHQNNVSSAQVPLRSGLHVNHFSIADGGRHTGSAGLKADPEPGIEAFPAEGFELLRLRTVFFGAIFDRAIGTCAISHGN
jgi:hypothetical protein